MKNLVCTNQVWYSGAKFKYKALNNILESDNLDEPKECTIKLDGEQYVFNVSYKCYWFNNFNYNEKEYVNLTPTVETKEKLIALFSNQNCIKTKAIFINELIYKINLFGSFSIETYFDIPTEINAKNYNSYFDDFVNDNEITLMQFKLAYQILNFFLDQSLIEWPNKYRFGVYIENDCQTLSQLSDKNNSNNIVYNDHSIHNSYLYRVHFFTFEVDYEISDVKSHYENKDFEYDMAVVQDNVNSKEIHINIMLLWAYCIWQTEQQNLTLEDLTSLMDIDTYTMNEIVIYNSASFCYTDMLDKTKKTQSIIKYNDLLDIFKTNTYYLQKLSLFYMSFKNSVTSFVEKQKTVEHFSNQLEFYKTSEEKFIHIYNAIEANEKSYANRMMQYILTALTLLTIISVSKDTIEFIKAEFGSEDISTKLDFISRSEFLLLLLVSIIFMFFKVKKYINKI